MTDTSEKNLKTANFTVWSKAMEKLDRDSYFRHNRLLKVTDNGAI